MRLRGFAGFRSICEIVFKGSVILPRERVGDRNGVWRMFVLDYWRRSESFLLRFLDDRLFLMDFRLGENLSFPLFY